MIALMKKVRQVMTGDRRGVTALEYGLIAAVIGGVVIAAANTFGTSLSNAYGTIGTKLEDKATAIGG
jgi:pilus assembly protein Flp/PilA